MHRLLSHAMILAGAGVGGCLCWVAIDLTAPELEANTLVVTVPARAPVPLPPQRPLPPTNASNPAPSVKPVTTPSDRAAIARALQGELKRVGCYRGEINGIWGPQSKQAMRTFTDRVNARLPIDDPDYILLSLVQSQKGHVCGGTGEVDEKTMPPTTGPIAGAPPPSGEPRLLAPPVEVKRPPKVRPVSAPQRTAEEGAPVAEPAATPPPPAGGLIPSAGVHEPTPPKPVPATRNQPPVVVRKLINGVKGALASIGLPN